MKITEPNKQIVTGFARLITGFGEKYNRFKINGLEHVPKEGAALIVMYHGLVPLDFWYMGLKIYLETGRLPRALADRWLFNTPGLAWLARNLGVVSADPTIAAELLKTGELVGVAPGGVREAIKGQKNKYRLVWGKRQGFAKLALQVGVPIIPGFTENVEGLYHAPFAEAPFFQKLYEKTRLPLVPIVGLGPLPFPVQLTTWFGPPILPQTNESVASLAGRTQTAIEALIHKHQKL